MKQKIEDSFGRVSLKEIEDVEMRNSISYPESYKKFLLQSNGGEPVINVFEIPNWIGARSCVNVLFGIHDEEYDNLEEYADSLAGRLPKGFVPIGDDPGGNLLCIGTEDEYRGKIYFWDHEDELDEEGLSKMDMSNMYWLANDIFEFLDKLTPDK